MKLQENDKWWGIENEKIPLEMMIKEKQVIIASFHFILFHFQEF